MTDETNRRANGQFTGVVPLDVVAREGGLSVMKGILEGRLPGAAMAKTLNFWLTTVEEGRIVFTGSPTVEHLNPLGTIHGGWASTIMDSSLACAVMTMIKPGEGYTTVEFKLNLTRPILPNMGELAARAVSFTAARQLRPRKLIFVTVPASCWRTAPRPARSSRSTN